MSVASSKKLFLKASTWQSGLQVLSGLPYLPEMLPVWGHCADASSWVTFDYINLIILLLQQGAQDWTPKVWVLAGRTELCLEPSPLWVPRARNTRGWRNPLGHGLPVAKARMSSETCCLTIHRGLEAGDLHYCHVLGL